MIAAGWKGFLLRKGTVRHSQWSHDFFPHRETDVLGTIPESAAQPGTKRNHEPESIYGKGFAGIERAAQAGTPRHTFFSPGLPQAFATLVEKSLFEVKWASWPQPI